MMSSTELKMDDENCIQNSVPKCLGNKSLICDTTKSDFGKDQHVNEAFEDYELSYNTSSSVCANTNFAGAKSRDENEDGYFSKHKNLPINVFALFRYSSTFDKCLIFIACFTAFCSGVLSPISIVLYGNIIDLLNLCYIERNNLTAPTSGYNASEFCQEEFLASVTQTCFKAVLVWCLVFFFNYIIVSFFSMTAANQVFKIRCMFMKSLLKQEIAWFDANQTDDIASKLNSDLPKLQDGIGEKVGICISFVSTSFLSISFALFYGWKLSLVCLCNFAIVPIATSFLSKIQSHVLSEELQIYEAAGAIAEEAISSIRTVISYGGQKKEVERYKSCLLPAIKKGIKRSILTGIGAAISWFCLFSSYSLAFWYGVKLIEESEKQGNTDYTPSILVVVFFNFIYGTHYFGQTIPFFEGFTLARGAAAKIFSIIERKPSIDSSSEFGKMPSSIQGNININNVYFNYPARSAVTILQGFSLKIKCGETCALVGPSGCGKSTLIQLIQRFYDTDKGSIEIDGINVKDLNVGWLRNNICVVSQEPVLFSTTISKNISYGKSGSTQEEIESAAKLANVHNFIETLPLKYDTLVGERGIQLSGGQKQRIAIARALIRNPKILLLDEATSALDMESESFIQSALQKSNQGRTTIFVAHRLSTIRNADKICVLTNGVVGESGSHDELMERKGTYYQLVKTQSRETPKEELYDEHLNDLERATSMTSRTEDKSDISLLRSARCSSLTVDIQEHVLIDDEGKEKVPATQARLLKFCTPEWHYILVGSICSIIISLLPPILGILYGDVLGILAEGTDKKQSAISMYSLIFIALAVFAFIVCVLQNSMFSIAAEKLTYRLRKSVFTKIISQDVPWFDDPKNGVGSLCARLATDASSVQGATGVRISTVIQAFCILIASTFVGLWFSYKIGLIVLCFVPLIFLATILEGRTFRKYLSNENTGSEQATKVAIDVVENIRTVASLHNEETFYSMFREALYRPHKLSRKISQVRGLSFGLVQIITPLSHFILLYFGCIQVAAGDLSYPDLLKVIEVGVEGTARFGQAFAFAPDYQKAKVAAARIFRLLDLKPKIDVFSTAGRMLDNISGYVSFKDIDFSYPSRPNVQVLQGLNLEIEPGQTVALVGVSGCGKSTCFHLLERFYNALGGEVMIDGANVTEINVSNLRSHIGLVSQDPEIFSCKIAENIAYGNNSRKLEMDAITSAAKEANIHTFISSLPQGYNTLVGYKGVQLSGGQRQRVAIARALYRNPKILLLDEATSALDAKCEKAVQEAFEKSRNVRTCLIIAHRLCTIQNADVIVVIHRGKVVEKGKHQELINLKGHYYNLHKTQTI